MQLEKMGEAPPALLCPVPLRGLWMTCRAKGRLAVTPSWAGRKSCCCQAVICPPRLLSRRSIGDLAKSQECRTPEDPVTFFAVPISGWRADKNLDFQVGWTQTPTRTGGATWGAERGGEGHGFLLEADEERQGRDFGMTNAGAQTLMEGSGCHVEATTAR